MGEARNRERRAQAKLSEAVCDEISLATAELVSQGVAKVVQAALAAEAKARADAGLDQVPSYHLTVGAEIGALGAMLAITWGFLPAHADRKDVLDQYALLVPYLVENLIGPAGQLAARYRQAEKPH